MNLSRIFKKFVCNYRNNAVVQSGFSLVEIIMVLVLIGVVGAIGTSGLSTFIKNFTLSRQGSDTTSTAQMSILRLAKELVTISAVNSSETNASKIRFTARRSSNISDNRFFRVELSGTNLNLIEFADATTTTASSTDLLANNVSTFSLQYYNWVSASDALSGTSAATWSNKVATLNGTRLIKLTLQMEGVGDPFTISIAPRNI